MCVFEGEGVITLHEGEKKKKKDYINLELRCACVYFTLQLLARVKKDKLINSAQS